MRRGRTMTVKKSDERPTFLPVYSWAVVVSSLILNEQRFLVLYTAGLIAGGAAPAISHAQWCVRTRDVAWTNSSTAATELK